jgi:hypothetical protein
MDMPDRPCEFRCAAAELLPRWSPVWSAAITVSVFAAVDLLPSVVGSGHVKAAFVANAVLAGAGSMAGGLLGYGTAAGRIVAGFGRGAFGVLVYAGMVCAVLGVALNPAFFAVTLAAWWAVLLAWHVSQ